MNACRSAGVVVAAGSLALGIVFGANIIRKRLRVFRCVGRQAIGADTAVSEGCWVTGIVVGGSRIVGLLYADQWTFRDLRVAPAL